MVIAKNQTWDRFGNLLHEETINVPYPALGGYQIVAALNAALGLWTLADAANVAGTSQEHLVDEVVAWFVAQQIADKSEEVT